MLALNSEMFSLQCDVGKYSMKRGLRRFEKYPKEENQDLSSNRIEKGKHSTKRKGTNVRVYFMRELTNIINLYALHA